MLAGNCSAVHARENRHLHTLLIYAFMILASPSCVFQDRDMFKTYGRWLTLTTIWYIYWYQLKFTASPRVINFGIISYSFTRGNFLPWRV
jgi:hypothetical protein